MVKLTIGNNTSRKSVIVPEDAVVGDVLNENNIDTNIGTITLDGQPLSADELDMTLADLGVTEKAFLVSIVKSQNAR